MAKPSEGAMRRESKVVPGYDCRVECQHPVKGQHGIHSDEWWYVVMENNRALAMCVFSHHYPVPCSLSGSKPVCASIVLHEPREGGDACDWVVGGCSCEDYGAIFADDFFDRHGGVHYEQPESFWQAFEALLRERTG